MRAGVIATQAVLAYAINQGSANVASDSLDELTFVDSLLTFMFQNWEAKELEAKTEGKLRRTEIPKTSLLCRECYAQTRSTSTPDHVRQLVKCVQAVHGDPLAHLIALKNEAEETYGDMVWYLPFS